MAAQVRATGGATRVATARQFCGSRTSQEYVSRELVAVSARSTIERMSDNPPRPRPHPRMPAITWDPVTGEHRPVRVGPAEEEPVPEDGGSEE